jgi:uncharacterized membrane protein YfcA
MDAWLLAYAAAGAFFGFLAGLLGIGGGAVSVPIMTMLYAAQDFDRDTIFHVALGTGMASIVFTSLSSLRAHDKHGAVDWTILRRLTPGIVLGTFLATTVVHRIPTFPLALIFVVFMFYMSYSMFRSWRPKPTRQMPGRLGTFLAGGAIGGLSGIVAIGGGALSVPYMAFCNVPFHRAIGTSAAIGLPIALTGAIGYIVNGWGHEGLPPYSLGYVYLPALLGFSVASVSMAPIGARLAHKTSTAALKKIFAVVLLALALKMLSTLWGS